MKDLLMMSGSRRSHVKGPKWIVALVCMVSLFLIVVYRHAPGSSAACNLFSSRGCSIEELASVRNRELSDEETAAQVVIREILKTPPIHSKNPKVAFMFLTPGPLPFERLWHMFFDVSFASWSCPLSCQFLWTALLFVFSFVGCWLWSSRRLNLCDNSSRILLFKEYYFLKQKSLNCIRIVNNKCPHHISLP